MATVSEWFFEFAASLIERSGRADFPPADSGYWSDFRESLVRIGAQQDEADLAASVVCDMPNLYPDNYRPLVVEAVKKIQARKQAEERGVPAGSREQAEAASKGCVDCQGSGMTTRFIAEKGGNFGFACRCPLGRWIRAQQPPDSRLRDDPYWLPTRKPSEVDLPDLRTPADLRAFTASLATSKSARGGFIPPRPPRPQGWDARAVPGHAYLADAIGDPVVARELAPTPAPTRPPAALVIPEDDAASGWF